MRSQQISQKKKKEIKKIWKREKMGEIGEVRKKSYDSEQSKEDPDEWASGWMFVCVRVIDYFLLHSPLVL